MNNLAIFDLDGVLANTSDLHTLALFHAVYKIVGADAAMQPYLEARDGARTATKLAKLQKQFALSDQIVLDIDAAKRTHTIHFLSIVDPSDIAIRGLTALKAAGTKIAVASNSRREFVTQVLTALGVIDLVDFYIGGDEIHNPKPDPEIFLTTMAALDALPCNTSIFEDSEIGLTAARASGAFTIRVNPNKLVSLEQIMSVIPS